MICNVDGCGLPVRYKSAGLCNRHYLRQHRYGSPSGGGPEYGAAERWLASNIPAHDDECIAWPFGRFADGYGAVQVGGKKRRAHRLVCEMVHGAPPSPQHDAAHRCGRGHLGCVNDRHLYWATRAQNLADRVAHGTANRGPRNGQAKLAEDEARQILAMKGSGVLQREVAAQFNVSRELVGRIWRRQIWEWL